MLRVLGVMAVLGALTAAPPTFAQPRDCLTDAEIEAAFADQLRSGVFLINTSRFDRRVLCSGLTIAQAIQKLKARIMPETAPGGPPRADAPAVARAAARPAAVSQLSRYVGRYNTDKVGGYSFHQNPQLKAALARAGAGPAVLAGLKEYGVTTLIVQEDGMIVDRGCVPRNCSSMNYRIFVNQSSGEAALCMGGERSSRWYRAGVGNRPEEFADPCPDDPGSMPVRLADAAVGQAKAGKPDYERGSSEALPAQGTIMVRREDLVGGWVEAGDTCEGDVGITYYANGTWYQLGHSGTWSVVGDRLVEITTLEGDMGEGPKRLNPPSRTVSTIVSFSRGRMRTRGADGDILDLMQCSDRT